MYVCSVSQSSLTLSGSMDSSPPDSSVHGILQVRILEWVANPLSRGSPRPRDQTQVSCIAGRFFTVLTDQKPTVRKKVIELTFLCWHQFSSVAQSYLTLCDHIDCGPPGSSVHGILQVRILEWVAIVFSRESSLPRDPTQVSYTAGGLPVWSLWRTLNSLFRFTF